MVYPVWFIGSGGWNLVWFGLSYQEDVIFFVLVCPARRMESPVGGFHLPGEFPSSVRRWKPPVWINRSRRMESSLVCPARRMESPAGGFHLPGEFPSSVRRWKPPVWFNRSRRMESPAGGFHLPVEFPSSVRRWKPPVWINPGSLTRPGAGNPLS